MKNVVVTTDKRGVFFGKLKSYDEGTGVAVLKEAKMCIYWSEKTRGVLGLASCGPQAGSKITAKVSKIKLTGVTSVMDCTEEAEKAWGGELWG